MRNAKHVGWFLSIACYALTIGGCVTQAPKPYPAWHEDFPGFSLIVPGDQWRERSSGRKTCSAAGEWPEPCETILLSGHGFLLIRKGLVPPAQTTGGLKPHLGTLRRDPLEQEADEDRAPVSIVSRTFEPDRSPGGDCFFLREEIRYSGGGTLFGLYPVSIFASGYLCSHPDKANYLIWLECGQLVHQYDAPQQEVSSQCEGVLSSFSLTSLR